MQWLLVPTTKCYHPYVIPPSNDQVTETHHSPIDTESFVSPVVHPNISTTNLIDPATTNGIHVIPHDKMDDPPANIIQTETSSDEFTPPTVLITVNKQEDDMATSAIAL